MLHDVEKIPKIIFGFLMCSKHSSGPMRISLETYQIQSQSLKRKLLKIHSNKQVL